MQDSPFTGCRINERKPGCRQIGWPQCSHLTFMFAITWALSYRLDPGPQFTQLQPGHSPPGSPVPRSFSLFAFLLASPSGSHVTQGKIQTLYPTHMTSTASTRLSASCRPLSLHSSHTSLQLTKPNPLHIKGSGGDKEEGQSWVL